MGQGKRPHALGSHPRANFSRPQGLTKYLQGQWQAIFFRRRHQPRSPPHAKIRPPGTPAPAMGTGTGQEIPSQDELAPVNPPEVVSPTPLTKTRKPPLGALGLDEKPKLVERRKLSWGLGGETVSISAGCSAHAEKTRRHRRERWENRRYDR